MSIILGIPFFFQFNSPCALDYFSIGVEVIEAVPYCLGLHPRDSLSFPMFLGLFLLVSVRQPLKHREFSHYPGLSYIFNQALYLIMCQG